MYGWNVDVVSVACILGGAALGGGMTVAALEAAQRGDASRVVVEAPRTAVVVRVEPDVAIRFDRVHVRMEDVQLRMEEARARMEEARVRVEEARVRVAEGEARVDATLGRELEERLSQELKRLERELSRLDDGNVR